MNVLIIEDEYIAAEELAYNLKAADDSINVMASIETVEEAILFLTEQPMPNLIFSDIQLADGLSFEIFETIKPKCPVIFCTAFDEYAIKAFQTNGIDYILKPFDQNAISKSLSKFKDLKAHFQKDTPSVSNDILAQHLQNLVAQLNPKTQRKSFLVHHRGKHHPISIEDIAYFYTEFDNIWLVQNNGEKFTLNHRLDDLEQMLDADQFFRANRQFIINHAAIREFEPYFNRKLSVKLRLDTSEPLLISKEKATTFIKWLER